MNNKLVFVGALVFLVAAVAASASAADDDADALVQMYSELNSALWSSKTQDDDSDATMVNDLDKVEQDYASAAGVDQDNTGEEKWLNELPMGGEDAKQETDATYAAPASVQAEENANAAAPQAAASVEETNAAQQPEPTSAGAQDKLVQPVYDEVATVDA